MHVKVPFSRGGGLTRDARGCVSPVGGGVGLGVYRQPWRKTSNNTAAAAVLATSYINAVETSLIVVVILYYWNVLWEINWEQFYWLGKIWNLQIFLYRAKQRVQQTLLLKWSWLWPWWPCATHRRTTITGLFGLAYGKPIQRSRWRHLANDKTSNLADERY